MRRAWPVRLLLTLAVCGCAGCMAPLFPEEDDRTPFDGYDAVRNQQEPAQESDDLGRRRPNLRGRLSRR